MQAGEESFLNDIGVCIEVMLVAAILFVSFLTIVPSYFNSLSLFLLKRKSNQKVQEKSNGSAGFFRPAHLQELFGYDLSL
jgi:hypothetical protein